MPVKRKSRKASAAVSVHDPDGAYPGEASFPVVGIGASAGGFEALGELLRELPADTGMAFVIVQHLDPTHVSMLAELLARYSRIPVTQVRSGMAVEPNQVYVIPPNVQMIIERGILRLSPRTHDPGPPMPIDMFLRSLAQDRRGGAIGVILSGTASDGTQGVTAIKAEGGLTIAQDSSTAKFPDMPRNAVASGAVDLVLSPAAIAARLAALAHPARLPVAKHGAAHSGAADPLTPIFHLLRARSNVDFSLYKRASVERRIARNLAVRQLDSIAKYAQWLKKNPAEVDALLHDLLIKVTHFFRDPTTFTALKKKVFPAILKNRKADSAIRVWVPGCATGEEVYSIAIVLLEFLEDMVMNTPIQIFGTDLSERAIEHARAGIFARDSVRGRLSPDRLRRFFNEVDRGYQISGAVRDLCIFARHNLVEDPPFSRLDLVSCRNVLIYLGTAMQRRALDIFYYSLKPDGFLTLGTSESLDSRAELFAAADKKHNIYCRKNVGTRAGFFVPRHTAPAGNGEHPPSPPADSAFAVSEVQREADRVILSRFAPAGVLIHQDGTILQFRGQTGNYLEPASGEASLNLFRMAREGLAPPLRSALATALKKNLPVVQEGVRVSTDDAQRLITLRVIPLHTRIERDRYLLVLFEDAPPPAPARRPPAPESKGAAAQAHRETTLRLKQELASARSYLQSIIEEREAANEELKSANEEVQSSNEEIQSANEELETAKEELQSTNEELITVNDELQTRNTGLSVLNNDLANLLGSVNIPIVMLNQELRIRRFTPLAEKVLNLIPGDIGRPMRDIQPNIDAPDLEELFLEVLRTLEVREREVKNRNGAWYLLRVRPYKTTDNRIDGVVLALVEIDALKRAFEQERSARDLAEATLETVQDSLIVLDSALSVLSANRAFYQTFRIPREETEGRHVYDLDHSDWNFPELHAMLEEVVSKGVRVQDLEVERDFNRFGRRTLLLNARPFGNGGGAKPFILLAIADITDRKQTAEARYRRLFETAPDGILVVDGETGRITDVNPYAVRWLGYARDEVLGKRLWTTGALENSEAAQFAFREIQEQGCGRYDVVELRTKPGAHVEAEIVGNLYSEGNKKVIQFNIRDITERRRTEQIRSSLKEKEILLREIHHRVKNNLQMITSLLSLQSRFIQDRQALRMFDETRNRVKAIAVVHELLYETSGAALADLKGYIGRLALNLFDFYGADPKAIRLSVEVGDVALMLDKAIPCGLILNELISNCLKHAFPGGGRGEIAVSLVCDGDRYLLKVLDTGVGFRKDIDLNSSGTLGLQLVNILADQLGGSLSFHFAEPTEVAVAFPASARRVN